VLGAVVYIMIKYKPEDLFTRALYFLIAGFIGFFWVTSIHDHVEPQWTIPCSIAMIIVLYNNSTVNNEMFRFTRRVLLPIVLLMMIARILLISDFPPGSYFGFNGKRAKYKFIESVAKDLPVLFPGSFQKPSLYYFFTGKESISINTLYTRNTEFDIWQKEKNFHNKPVFIYGFAEGRSGLYKQDGMEFYGYITDSLQTVNRIDVKVSTGVKLLHPGDSLCLSVNFRNPYPYDINFSHGKFPVTICMAFLQGRETHLYPVISQNPVGIIRSGETITRTLSTLVPDLTEGRYRFGISLQTALGPVRNDSFSEIKIAGR
jgi:hypothetical protein